MNYAIPMYVCQKDESPGRAASFSCTVEIGGIRYIGAAARTKKEAEIKAARTALLAIRANTDGVGEKSIGNTQLTVIPGKKKGPESGNPDEPAKALKPKKARFKTKGLRKKFPGNKVGNDQVEDTRGMEVDIDNQVGSELLQTDASMVQVAESGLLSMESKENFEEEKSIVNQNGGDKTVAEGDPIPDIIEVLVSVAMEVNNVSEAGLVDSAIMNSSNEDQTEAASAAKDFKQMGANEDDFKSNGASALGIVASNLG
ncbi:Double-stranded RNA-binding protein 1 [Vitis vinifera]|uniref:Double-stranded RNA-binding protein 1 n=1 Tax=Vitis vinifera TaxID=29760 RepID=A0A438G039_VITVI|nr:Double-stranded RNA-binding protein 1 [Vitis vinifera]